MLRRSWLFTIDSSTIPGHAHRKAPRAEQSLDVLGDAEEETGHDEVRNGVETEKVCDQAGQGLGVGCRLELEKG